MLPLILAISAILARAQAARVLVVGSGAREHAIVKALLPRGNKDIEGRMLMVSPGNPGMCQYDPLAPIQLAQGEEIEEVARKWEPDLVVVGPEAPLVDGLADRLRAEGLLVVGPNAAAAVIEADKGWARDFMKRHELRGPASQLVTSEGEIGAAVSMLVDSAGKLPPVVKRVGLCGGKGVVVPTTLEDCETAAKAALAVDKKVLLEEQLAGLEVSLFAFTDGNAVLFSPPSTDHKRLLDESDEKIKNPNTGGMGAICPAPFVTLAELREMEQLMLRTIRALRKEGRTYQGVLYGGFMIDPDREVADPSKVAILEYNCRLGDPEAQVVLPYMARYIDAYDLFKACALEPGEASDPSKYVFEKELSTPGDDYSVSCVVLASEGYPNPGPGQGSPQDIEIGPLPLPDLYDASDPVKLMPFATGGGILFAGVAVDPKSTSLQTSGGRVLSCVGAARHLRGALACSYMTAQRGSFHHRQFRGDIGRKALFASHLRKRRMRVAMLASNEAKSGRDVLLRLRDDVDSGMEVALVCSNKESAPILQWAAEQKFATAVIPNTSKGGATGNTLPEHEKTLEDILEKHQVEVVLLVGYNRILSEELCRRWAGCILNVHPALLPEARNIPGAAGKGAFDLRVHEAIIKGQETRSGCTVHMVTAEPDAGPVMVREEIQVHETDTPSSLKERIQEAETRCLWKALALYRDADFSAIPTFEY